MLNGYRYHTKYDHIDYLPSGVLQRTGDNILGLVKMLANSNELTNTEVCSQLKENSLKKLCAQIQYCQFLIGICKRSNGVL